MNLAQCLLCAGVILVASSRGAVPALPDASMVLPLAAEFAQQVDMRLEVPHGERVAYARRLDAALFSAGHTELAAQYVVLVDRSPMVQVVFIYWRSPHGEWHTIGASPASTGRPGAFDHFLTPVGVFEHTPDNMDFRAEGTRNPLGIRGYGARGMRVYDFGWVLAERGWGPRGKSAMRLQMHATDPDILEPRLGRTHSKGCIRIPASLNVFIDRNGLLDAEYQRAAEEGRHLQVLLRERTPTPWPGKYLVVIDSERAQRPLWARWPARQAQPASPPTRGVKAPSAVC